MTILHTVNKSPFDKEALASCLSYAADGSAVLLFEDGIYAAARGTEVEGAVRAATARLSVYALGPDLEARGLARAPLIEGIRVVDYGGFVDLAAAHHAVYAWL